MQVYVINLERDKNRRDSIKTQMEKLDIPFDFFKAYYGKDLSSEEMAIHYSAKKTYRNFSMPLPPAHIGCSLSHLMLYKRMIDANIAQVCIFEDDVILPENTKTVLKSLENVISKNIPQVILLSPSQTNNSIVHNLDNFKIKPYKSGYFASSYIINNLAARSIYKTMYPVQYVADSWDYLKRHKIADILSLSPCLIEQDQDTFGSSTNDGQNDQNIKAITSSLKYKLHRSIFKPLDYIIAFYNRNFRPYRGLAQK
jgi:glycosyl transferase family 25